jgi:hypothetical protein
MSKVVKAVTNVVKGVVNVVKNVVKAVVNVVSSVINFVAQPFMGLLGGAPDLSSNAAEEQRQQGILIQQQGGGAVPIPVVYGYRKLAGTVTFAETGSTNNKYLWVAYTFSEGPVAGLREVWINDEQLPSTIIGDLNASKTVNIAEGKFKGRVSMFWSPGVYFATPSSSTLGSTIKSGLFAGSPSYKETMVHNGLATLFVRYEWLAINTQAEADANPFNGSIPAIQISLMGRQVASLATSASESYDYGATGYTEYHSYNPAEILLDYLRNPRYGKGLKNSEIDWDSWRTAAAKCATEVTYTTGTIKGPILTCNYVLDTGQTIFNNVKVLLQGFRGYMPYVQGKYKLKIEDAGHPTDILSGAATIVAECVTSGQIRDESLLENTYEIMGDIVYTGIERSNKYNQVVVTYVDPDQKWSTQQMVYPQTEAERLTYQTADGGRENKLDITFPTITNYAMAYDFARLLFNKSRYQETCSVKVSSHAFEIEPGDCIRIQGTILNFADTPWRVVSVAYNDDYTFDLGCVRNPDSLYPYTRVGEPDTVLPIYVPKGATIYYPKELESPSIGLKPPSQPIYNAQPTPPVYNPTPPAPPVPPNDGGNNPPPDVPKPKPLDNVVDFSTVSYVVKNGLTYARITFNQPDHAMYQSLVVYYRLSGNTAGWSQYEETTRPGVNQSITFDLGPLAIISTLQATANVYDLYARVKYSTGELSTQFVRLQLNPATDSGTISNPSETVQLSSSAWPSFAIADPAKRDTKLESVTGTVASMPSVGVARAITFNLVQDVRTQAINTDVAGVNVYYKVSTDTYYTKVTQKFTGYSPGTTYSFLFSGDVGVSGGPSTYDFVFRLNYTDGSESTNQYIARINLVSPVATYPYNPFYGIAPNVKTITEYPIITVDQAPPGSVASALDTKLGIGSGNSGIRYKTAGTSQGMAFYLDPPDVSNRATWRGTKIRYRPVTAGANPSLTTQIDRNVLPNPTSGIIYIETWGITFDQVYEIIITPIVVSGGVEQEATYSLFGHGLVHNRTSATDYPANDNWAPSFNFQLIDTKTALNTAGQAFAAVNPTVDIISADVRLSKFGNTSSSYYYKATGSTTVERTPYLRLVYNGDKITGLSKIIVYRRERQNATWYTSPTSGYAKYYTVGRWERIEITHTGTGNKIVNLRVPTSYQEFDPYYQVSGYTGKNLVAATSAGEAAGTVPLSASPFQYTDLVIVAVVGTTESGLGTFIRGKSVIVTSSSWTTVDLISPNKPTIINYSTDPVISNTTFDAGFQRRISEARSPVATASTDKYPARNYSGVTTPTIALATPADGPATV